YKVTGVQTCALPISRLSEPGLVLVVSDLTRMECRVKPMRERDLELLRDYDEFFSSTVAEVVPLSRAVIDLATEIRASHGFKTPRSEERRVGKECRTG